LVKTEHEEQREFVQWMRQTHPTLRIYAIPNGGHRGASQGARLKAEGVTAGVPDLHVPALRLWIEMKRASGGTVSREQRDWHDYLRGIGDRVIVAKGKEEAIRAITDLL
jgi:hypothetical protein